MTEQFIFVEQKITRQGKDIALCIAKCKVKSGRENIATAEVARLLNAKSVPVDLKELVKLYESHDDALKKECYQSS